MDWVNTRLLVPGSNSQCSRPGSGSNVCFQHPDTGLSSCTGEQLPHLKSQSKELHNVPITHKGLADSTDFNIRNIIWMSYLAVWLRPHKTHWGCHNRDRSIQSDTGRCKRLPAASTSLHFYTGMNHTSEQDSNRKTKTENT